MREMLERLLRSADVPNPERAEQLWAEYRTGGAGANKAFATLLAWYGNVLYRRIWGFLRSDAADDVFQDVLTRLHKERANFATFDHALNWMRSVAVAFSLNAHRGDRRRRARDERAARPEAQPPGEATGEVQEMIRVGLAKLPEEHREAVALHYFEGLTKRDAAAVLGIDRDTLAKRLQEALGRLRQLVPVPAVAAAGGVAVLEAELAASVPLTPTRMATLIAATGPAAVAGWLWSAKTKVFAAVLVLGLAAVASGYYLTRSPDMPPQSSPQTVRLGLEPLEGRTVPSAGFLSALSIGNDTGGSGAEAVAVDAAGNSYLTGYFSGTVDFDPTRKHAGNADVVTARGASDAFVAKYAPDNTLIWVRRMGGDQDAPPNTDRGRAIAVDGSGNVYVTGTFLGTADFGSFTRTSLGVSDGFTVKLNASGTVVWANRWGGAAGDTGYGVGVDAAGNVYASGNGTEGSLSGHRVVKFKANGSNDWSHWIGTRTQTESAMALDSGGNVYIGGHFTGTTDFNPAAGNKNVHNVSSGGGGQNSFVLKLTSAGTFSWVAPFLTPVGTTTTTYARVNTLAVDGSGNVIVGGAYKGLADFNPGTGTYNLPPPAGTAGNVFVTKLNASGGFAWAKALEAGTYGPTLSAVKTDSSGNIYLAGMYRGEIDFDPGAGVQTKTATGIRDTYVLKLDGAGDFAWVKSFEGRSGEQFGTGSSARGIAVDQTGTVYVVGHHQGTTDFDPDELDTHEVTTASTEFSSIYCVKLSQN